MPPLYPRAWFVNKKSRNLIKDHWPLFKFLDLLLTNEALGYNGDILTYRKIVNNSSIMNPMKMKFDSRIQYRFSLQVVVAMVKLLP